jgi:ribosomal protein L37AE/L43A
MDVQTCPRCGKPLATEVATSFLCCLDCKRRLLGYASWPVGGPSGVITVYRTKAEAESTGKGLGSTQLSPVWTDIGEE